MKNILTVFCESDGSWSMRRLLAFIFAAGALALGILGLPWQVVGILAASSLLLLFFTTWADIASVVKVAKGGQ